MPRDVTAFSNPQVKRARSLRDKKHRKREGLFLAEGLRILAEASDAGRLPEQIFFSGDETLHPLAAELVEKTEAAGGEAIRTTSEILAKLSGKDNPQTVLGVYAEFGSGIDQVDRSTAPIWLVAQALRDPGNIGTMLRTGDAVGAGGLFLIDDCADPFSVEAVRASMGAIFTQRLCQTDWQNFLDWKGREPGQLVGLSLDTDLDYQAPRYEPPVFILVGNESAGLPKDYADSCDLLVKIPMHGKADSLNAAISGAVMAYEALSQLHR